MWQIDILGYLEVFQSTLNVSSESVIHKMVSETENSNLYLVYDASKPNRNWNYQGLTLGKETEACGRNCLSSCLKNLYQIYHQQGRSNQNLEMLEKLPSY